MKQYSEAVEEYNAEKDPKKVNAWAVEWDEIKKAATTSSTSARNVKTFGDKGYLHFLSLDALLEEDWPNNISQNSIYLDFRIDLFSHKVELHSCGHVWLSPKDKASEKYKYFAMRSMKDIAKDYGVKPFRKQGFKNATDLLKKITTYYKAVMKAITDYTGGYLYKEGI